MEEDYRKGGLKGDFNRSEPCLDTIINIIVLYLLLKHFLIGPVTNIMERRRQMIEDGFKNARRRRRMMQTD